MGIHVALLRGINVGGRNRLAMADLRTMFADAGCDGVRTYIQSGNVVFSASAALARRIPALITRAIAEGAGLDVPVVVRAAAELETVVAGNPFLDEVADPRWLHVAFLRDTPDAGRATSLDPDRSPPDRFVLRGREIYLHTPNGMGRSKLTAQYFDSRLKTVSTARNWNTVLTLLEMATGA